MDCTPKIFNLRNIPNSPGTLDSIKCNVYSKLHLRFYFVNEPKKRCRTKRLTRVTYISMQCQLLVKNEVLMR